MRTLRDNFHRGTREGLHEWTPTILREIDELLKMLDAQSDELRPEHFRDGFAPGFVKLKPHVLLGAWIRSVRAEFAEFGERPWFDAASRPR